MRHIKLTLGLAVTVCACAVTAAPALANVTCANAPCSFVGSELGTLSPLSGTFATKGVGIGNQKFKFLVKVICAKAKSTGSVTFVAGLASKLTDSVTYGKCNAYKTLPATFLSGPVTYTYFAEPIPQGEPNRPKANVEVSSGEVEIKIKRINCIIHWPAQIVPNEENEKEYKIGTYENNEESEVKLKKEFVTQTKLEIKNQFARMEYTISSGLCEELLKGFEYEPNEPDGTYQGTLQDEIKGDNLGWEEEI